MTAHGLLYTIERRMAMDTISGDRGASTGACHLLLRLLLLAYNAISASPGSEWLSMGKFFRKGGVASG